MKQKLRLSVRTVLVIAAGTSILGITLFLIFLFNIGNVRSLLASGTTYYSRQNGAWNNKATWSTQKYGGAQAASYPQAGDIVYIKGNTIAITQSNESCAKITFEDHGTLSGELDVSNGHILNVSSDVTFDYGASSGNMILDIAGDGTTVNVGGNLTALLTGGSGIVQVKVENTSILNVGGNASISLKAGNGDASITTTDSSQVTVDGNTSLTSTGGTGSGTIDMQDSSTMTTSGDMTVTSGTQNSLFINLTDNSALTIGGNLTTDLQSSTYQVLTSVDNSTVTFQNMTTGQSADGTSNDTVTVSNLVVNNASSGVTLNTNFIVTTSLTLTAGVLKTTSTTLLVMREGSTVNGGSISSYVDGPMRKDGSSAFVFPLGRNGIYAPLGISSPGSYSKFTSEYFDGPYTSTVSSSALQNVSTKEHWTLTKDYGTATPKVSLYWMDGGFSGILDLSTLKVAYYDNNNNRWEDAGQSAVSGAGKTGNSGYITSNTPNDYTAFTFGSTDFNPLPVKLVNFRATPSGSGVKLSWTTASEINNDYFEVERSQDARHFETAGKVKGNGNSQALLNYSMTDEKPYDGKSYYRLKQVDFNGAFEYFKITPVEMAVNNIESIGPNPFNSQFSMKYSLAEAGPVTIQLISMTGAVVHTDDMQGMKGINSYDFVDNEGLKEGTYILRLVKDGSVVNSKVVKSR